MDVERIEMGEKYSSKSWKLDEKSDVPPSNRTIIIREAEQGARTMLSIVVVSWGTKMRDYGIFY